MQQAIGLRTHSACCARAALLASPLTRLFYCAATPPVPPCLQEKGRVFRESFLSKLALLLRGTVAAPPERFGETLADEHIRGGAFVGPDNKPVMVNEQLPNAHMRLFGGAQYHRAMAEFRAGAGWRWRWAAVPGAGLVGDTLGCCVLGRAPGRRRPRPQARMHTTHTADTCLPRPRPAPQASAPSTAPTSPARRL